MAANLFEQYGIKEVADVQFEDIESGQIVLYLDTLKVSTIETTAEQTEAKGGKGNPPLIIWDFGKEISVTLEDALFSMTSLVIGQAATTAAETIPIRYTQEVILTTTGPSLHGSATGTVQYINYSSGVRSSVTSSTEATSATLGSLGDRVKLFYYVNVPAENALTITISSKTFPGTYRVIGDTYVRSQSTGKDSAYQFIIEKAKVNSENTLTMEAEGDPTVFNMSLRVLRDDSGNMIKFIKYSL